MNFVLHACIEAVRSYHGVMQRYSECMPEASDPKIGDVVPGTLLLAWLQIREFRVEFYNLAVYNLYLTQTFLDVELSRAWHEEVGIRRRGS